ncbi:hypothetical protein XEUV315_23965 [Xanthomonas euvesicatoria]|nr:hypothetical protein XEUV315_23965 [Xanthomonas euvesicatoria]
MSAKILASTTGAAQTLGDLGMDLLALSLQRWHVRHELPDLLCKILCFNCRMLIQDSSSR